MIARYQSTLTYRLAPTAEDAEAIGETLDAYGEMMRILDGLAREGRASANLVTLHEQAYARIREETHLPARLVTLGLRDHSGRKPGGFRESLPLDSRLYAVKSPTHLSLATIEGRRLIAYTADGYAAGWNDHAEARLVLKDGAFFILVGIAGTTQQKEISMANEGILSRIGRVIAGVAHGAADALEGANAITTVEQSIREIDQVADEARASSGKARAEEYRIKAKIADIDRELRDLAGKIEVGLANGREDLVKPVIGRQIDLEAQRAALDTALAEAAEKIEDADKALQAINSARQDAVARLAALRKSQQAEAGTDAPGAAAANGNKLARSMGTIERVTGVPGGPATGAAEVEELTRLQRERAIQARLNAYKGKSG